MKVILAGIAVGFASLLGLAVSAQAQPLPPAAYQDLLFNRPAEFYVFRLNGTPWICPASADCRPVHFDGVADKDLATADIASLGFAERRYFLSFRQTNYDKARTSIFTCLDDRCSKLDGDTGDSALIDTYPVKQGDQTVTRTAILRNVDARNGRSQILWCGEIGCTELPVTRDNEVYLALMGHARLDNSGKVWLREKSGWVMECSQPGEGIDDRLECSRTDMMFANRSVTTNTPPAPPPSIPAPGPPIANPVVDQQALSSALDSAIRNGDFVTADRLLADGTRRFPQQAVWPRYQQQLAQARAARDLQQRTDESRRLIGEARRFANYDDFDSAERMLQEAARVYPNFPEVGQARADIGRQRAARDQDLREQYQYSAAIDRAFQNYNLWEAERLIGAARQRYPQDPSFRDYANRLAQVKAQAQWQERLRLSRGYVAAARSAMDKGDYSYAERQLTLADQTTPGLPEIGQAQSDLSRLKVRAEVQNQDIRRLIAAIEASTLRKQFDDADKLYQDGKRRYPGYAGWNEVQRNIDQARRGNDQQTRDQQERRKKALDLISAARQASDKGDYNGADKLLDDANKLVPGLPDIAVARADIDRQQADRKREEKDIAAIAASVDAAIKRNQYPAAEQLVRDGQRKYPNYKGWDELQKRVADGRKAWDTGPNGKPVGNADQQKPDSRVVVLLGQAKSALARNDLAGAETAIAAAEKIDAKAPTVVAARADLDKQKTAAIDKANGNRIVVLLGQAKAAQAKNDFAGADTAIAAAEKIDAKAPTVAAARADLDAAKKKHADDQAAATKLRDLLAETRRDTAAGKFAEAEVSLKQAEALQPNSPDVKAMRVEFDKRKAAVVPAKPGDNKPSDNKPGDKPTGQPTTGQSTTGQPTTTAPPAGTTDKVTADKVAALVAQARDAIKKDNFKVADTAIDAAEKLDPKAPDVIKVRAEYEAARKGDRPRRNN